MDAIKFLRRKVASAYLREKFGLEYAPSTLAKLAVVGGGPPFRRMNRVPLYDPADLDQWVASKLGPRMRSTSEGARHAAIVASKTASLCDASDPSKL
ncbi:hypothetical protein GCM10007857_61770 [Bradyrhizobium iriomotense]|uniref:Transcriptional regulator n=1 Tax=Bradyrhizobium iriomotense TaxID=441950 RepID=A0ABQ6B7T9_9BRAD|nr:hypothetical protein GCM10007857_61770 [Bradyrhizobium iriomotense]